MQGTDIGSAGGGGFTTSIVIYDRTEAFTFDCINLPKSLGPGKPSKVLEELESKNEDESSSTITKEKVKHWSRKSVTVQTNPFLSYCAS